jgi:ABC-2 type transport system permease protein
MKNAFYSEWLKLRRARFLLGCFGASAAVGILGSVVSIATSSTTIGPEGGLSSAAKLAQADGLVSGLGLLANLLGLVALVIGAFSVAQEFSTGSIRNLLVRQPHRGRLLAGKLAAIGTLIVACAAVTCLLAVASAFAFAPLKAISTTAWATTDGLSAVLRTSVRVFGAQILFGTLGTCLAMLFRSPTPAISIGLAWTLLVEMLLATISSTLSRFLPGRLASALIDGGTATIGFRVALIGTLVWVVAGLGVSYQKIRQLEIS